MKNAEHCGAPSCEKSGVSSIDGAALCRSHFIDTCYERLEQYEEMRKGHSLSVSEAESMRRFIHECSRQSDEIEHTATDLDNLDRAKLLHIILTASENDMQQFRPVISFSRPASWAAIYDGVPGRRPRSLYTSAAKN